MRAGAWHLLGAGIGLIRYATFVRWCLPGSILHLLGGVGLAGHVTFARWYLPSSIWHLLGGAKRCQAAHSESCKIRWFADSRDCCFRVIAIITHGYLRSRMS